MKRLLTAILSLALLVSVLSIPANAVSSGGLKTYTLNGSKYVEKAGLGYDLEVSDLRVRHAKKNDWNKGADDIVLSPKDGEMEFGTVVIASCDKDSGCAAIETPIIKCWIDDEPLDDGIKPKACYAVLEKRLGTPYFAGTPGFVSQIRHDFIEATWNYVSSMDYSYSVKTPYSFDTRTMALGKHTLRFAINPEYVSEEMDTGNNEITRTVYIKETSPAAPEAPVLEKASANSVAVQTVPGLEYSIDGGLTWQDSGIFSGLTPETAYEIVSRVKETETALAGQVSPALSAVTTSAKQTATAPEAPVVLRRTDVSIVLESAEGLEYSIDHGTTWQLSPIFAGLTAGTEYAITARYAETDLAYASPESAPITVRTKLPAPAAPAVPRLLGRTDTTISVC